MNACITLLMGLAAMGYQPVPGDILPPPVPPAEEIAPAPLPVEASPATPPMVPQPAVPQPDADPPPVKRPSSAAPIDAFAPEEVESNPPMLVVPSPVPSSPGPALVPQAMPLGDAVPYEGFAPFPAEPALAPIPMSLSHGSPVRHAACQCSCEKPAESSCRHHCCLGKCCENSTCDMPPHVAYFPAHHGYYYFRPYNDTHVAEHQAIITALGGDPRAPYSTADFARFYDAFQGTGYDQPLAEPLRPLPHLSRPLPNLESLLPHPAVHP